MTLEIILVIAALVILLIALAWPRVRLPRRPGFEGIEDAKAAEAYDRISRWPQFRLLQRMTVRILSKYRPTGTLADIGCGPGRMTTLIAREFPQLHVLGLDTALEMVRAADANAASLGLSGRVEFREGDIASLPLPDGTLDFAVSSLSLHHWSDPVRGLAEIQRVLKPDGQFLLFDLRRDARRFFYLLMRFAQTVVVPPALRNINEPLGSLQASYTPAEMEALLSRSPFRHWKISAGIAWLFIWGSKF